MNWYYSLIMALDNLRVNKLRAGLTILGIVLGVSAVIIMVAIMEGFSAQIKQQFEKIGSNLIIIAYAPDTTERKETTRRIDGLRMEDVRAIRTECDLIGRLSPEMMIGGATAKYAAKNTDVTVTGAEPDYPAMRNAPLERGRFVRQEDEDTWARICMIGTKTRDELFGAADPMGKIVEVNGQDLTVVGIMQSKGRTFEGDADHSVFVPLSTLQKRFLGDEKLNIIYASPKSLAVMDAAKDQVWQLLMRRYNNLPGFRVDSLDSMLESINKVMRVFTAVMGGIAALAMLVGGIGIMNIMLVSVTERTREIGLRKAVGARKINILTQFLVEAATMSGLGGIIGVVIGTAMAYAIGYITAFIPELTDPQSGHKGLETVVPLWASLGSFLISAVTGMFFGIYPAMRAASLSPIEALRHE